MGNIFFYSAFIIAFVIFILCIPDKILTNVLAFLRFQKEYFLQIANKLPFLGVLRRGEKLLDQVSEWSSESALGIYSKNYLFFDYKFYSKLLTDLFKLERQEGVSVKNFLIELRKSIMKDIAFEKKKLSEIFNGFYQMFFMSVIVFSFIFVLEGQLGLHVPYLIKSFIFIWQCLGAVAFIFAVYVVERKIFRSYGDFAYYLYRLRSLCFLGIDSSTLFKSHRAFGQALQGDPKLKGNLVRVESLLIRLRDKGSPIGPELKEIQDDLWEDMLFEFEKFQKKLFFMKFFVLTFFFLATYLVFVLYLFSFFME